MPHNAAVASWSAGESHVGSLAEFFVDASPVRIPVRLSGLTGAAAGLAENSVIEFGTPREILFASRLPLEFGDKLQVENADKSLVAEVTVVALQFHYGRTAVAGRFSAEVANWIVKGT